MIPLALLLVFALPALVPQSGPLSLADLMAQWAVCGLLAAGVAGWRTLDDFGSSETTIRADEARAWLACMNDRRVG
jgi:hypothetical protein